MHSARILHADAVLPQDGPALRDGAVVVATDGRIVDVGRAADVLPRHAGLPVARVSGAIFPGLVNAHTHLELSWLRGRVGREGQGFLAWVDRLVALRSEESEAEACEAALAAVGELEGACTVAVGDVSNTLRVEGELVSRDFAGAVFHEIFGVLEGPLLDRIAPMLAAWKRPSDRLARAPAPHTLYTTHPSGVRALLAFARERGLVTSIHLAEHASEREAVERATGSVPAWLEERLRIPRAEHFFPREPLFDYAQRLGVLAPDVVLVHLTDARPDELARVRDAGARVVLCPRSNLHIEGRLPDVPTILARGVEPGLGTDSLASCASLDVLADARVLVERFPDAVSPEVALRMATWNGARALGRSDVGRIAAGARPSLHVAEGELGADPSALVLDPNARRRRL
jgi:cytosine/adenosine deaminase-related metal-dependent hydrolase